MSDEKEKHNVTVSPPETHSLPSLPPIRRQKSGPYNPLDGLDLTKLSKEECYLMGFINGQMMGGRR